MFYDFLDSFQRKWGINFSILQHLHVRLWRV